MVVSRERGIVAGGREYMEDSGNDNLFDASFLLTFTCLYTYTYTPSYLLIRGLVEFYFVIQTSG